jgi:hypothetical protein
VTRRLLPLLALAIVALIGAGCSDTPAETSSNTSTTTNKNAGGRDKAMKFAACMRDNGVKEFPDPDASGEMTIDGVVNGSSLDASSAAFEAAIAACKDLQPAGFMGRKRSAKEQEPALKFAQCMRDNGIKDFPDPAKDGPLIDTTKIPSAKGRGALEIPGFKAAQEKCGDFLAGALDGR